jgi:hypothetical protein
MCHFSFNAPHELDQGGPYLLFPWDKDSFCVGPKGQELKI